MFRFRNLLAVGLAVVMLVLMTTLVSAQPVQQGTATPEATTLPSDTPVPTIAATGTSAPVETTGSVAVGAPHTQALNTKRELKLKLMVLFITRDYKIRRRPPQRLSITAAE